MPEPKTKPTAESVTDFLNKIPEEDRRKDSFALLELMRKASGAEPTMWGTSIVGFGVYKYKYESGHSGEAAVVGFSPRKTALTLYLGCEAEDREALFAKLGKHKTGKGCLYIKKLSDVDPSVLKQLIAATVKAMASKRIDQ
jgi:Domain of unknown function (DU1801)